MKMNTTATVGTDGKQSRVPELDLHCKVGNAEVAHKGCHIASYPLPSTRVPIKLVRPREPAAPNSSSPSVYSTSPLPRGAGLPGRGQSKAPVPGGCALRLAALRAQGRCTRRGAARRSEGTVWSGRSGDPTRRHPRPEKTPCTRSPLGSRSPRAARRGRCHGLRTYTPSCGGGRQLQPTEQCGLRAAKFE